MMASTEKKVADELVFRGYKEEGTITTPLDMTVLNDLDRFHLEMDASPKALQ
jgi:phosphoketolase